MRRTTLRSWVRGVCMLVVSSTPMLGCAAGSTTAEIPVIDDPLNGPEEIAPRYERALEAWAQHESASSWTPESCDAVSSDFLAAAESHRYNHGELFEPALYNAGLVFARCGDSARARSLFEEILAADAKFAPARVQLTLLRVRDGLGVDAAISELERASRDSEYQSVDAFVALAWLQMKRNATTATDDGESDMARAQKNLRRALAVQDDHLPAIDALANLYRLSALEQADAAQSAFVRGEDASRRADAQGLELALLVANQGLDRAPDYAPLHNTRGLIQVELRDLSAAAQAFDRARTLDPSSFEAQMNFASVNLAFRGFGKARDAYERALTLRPASYEARLGRALALRGLIEPATQAKLVPLVEVDLAKAKELAPDRPEAYFNDAMFHLSVKARGQDPKGALSRADELLRTFVAKAKETPRYADAIVDVTARPSKSDAECIRPEAQGDPACRIGRLLEIEEQLAFLTGSEEARQALEEQSKLESARRDAELLTH